MPQVESRKGHMYADERVTPKEEIPPQFQKTVPLPGGGSQIIDTRLAYNWQAAENRLVECGSVASHADYDGFTSPEDHT